MVMINFSRMDVTDLPSVMENEVVAYSHPWTSGIFADCIGAGHECWLFKLEEKLIGHSVLSIAADESHLQNVCIHPDYQGKGYGRLLVEHMLLSAKNRKAGSVFLEVRSSNIVAYKLYESLGFNEVGIRANYYPGDHGREDAIVFAKELFF